jgi:hypothetical protein
VVNTVPMAVCAYMMVVAYMLLFGGFIVRSDQLPDWMRWSLEVRHDAIPPLLGLPTRSAHHSESVDCGIQNAISPFSNEGLHITPQYAHECIAKANKRRSTHSIGRVHLDSNPATETSS